jgi:hypothetical protein
MTANLLSGTQPVVSRAIATICFCLLYTPCSAVDIKDDDRIKSLISSDEKFFTGVEFGGQVSLTATNMAQSEEGYGFRATFDRTRSGVVAMLSENAEEILLDGQAGVAAGDSKTDVRINTLNGSRTSDTVALHNIVAIQRDARTLARAHVGGVYKRQGEILRRFEDSRITRRANVDSNEVFVEYLIFLLATGRGYTNCVGDYIDIKDDGPDSSDFTFYATAGGSLPIKALWCITVSPEDKYLVRRAQLLRSRNDPKPYLAVDTFGVLEEGNAPIPESSKVVASIGETSTNTFDFHKATNAFSGETFDEAKRIIENVDVPYSMVIEQQGKDRPVIFNSGSDGVLQKVPDADEVLSPATLQDPSITARRALIALNIFVVTAVFIAVLRRRYRIFGQRESL